MRVRKPLLDDIDVGILERLQEDGRRPYTAIAESIGVSEANVRHRTKRMLRLGVFQIVAVADPIGLGFGTMALVTLRVKGPSRMRLAERVAAFPEVSYLALCAGSVDLLAEIVCRDRDHLLKLCESLAMIPGVELGETLVYLKEVKQSERWLNHQVAGMLDPTA